MDKEEREKLLQSWIKCQDATQNSQEYEAEFWAADYFMELEFNDPELLWSLICELYKRDLSDKVWGSLAAGPMESLLGHKGELFIDRIEEEAKCSPKFKDLLGGVWQNLMSDKIWERVKAAAGDKHW